MPGICTIGWVIHLSLLLSRLDLRSCSIIYRKIYAIEYIELVNRPLLTNTQVGCLRRCFKGPPMMNLQFLCLQDLAGLIIDFLFFPSGKRTNDLNNSLPIRFTLGQSLAIGSKLKWL